MVYDPGGWRQPVIAAWRYNTSATLGESMRVALTIDNLTDKMPRKTRTRPIPYYDVSSFGLGREKPLPEPSRTSSVTSRCGARAATIKKPASRSRAAEVTNTRGSCSRSDGVDQSCAPRKQRAPESA